ncbi:YciI family protein [Caldinitratiruptor microaerophilus]|uniref:YCII-related domain-containing protein n=1 Tax=Caldinitratiruptor microaerophilus TaxID=671077 RepID=A0AA35CKZ4_9FIRM|nr:YciI family protein [Caldinitratiruptor microaerophilus]BDG59230.1 hypothetical protein caldi_03200 [Caldinitratiruptor microaerophilus]
MKYAAFIHYVADQDKVQSVRPAHREYLSRVKAQGKLWASGPFTDGSGALIIYEAESEEEARRLLEDDPFHKSGVFASWELRPWQQVF